MSQKVPITPKPSYSPNYSRYRDDDYHHRGGGGRERDKAVKAPFVSVASTKESKAQKQVLMKDGETKDLEARTETTASVVTIQPGIMSKNKINSVE